MPSTPEVTPSSPVPRGSSNGGDRARPATDLSGLRSVRILEHLGAHRYRISVGGTRLLARSAHRLTVGMTVQADLRATGGTLQLRLAEAELTPRLQRLLVELNLQDTPASRTALQAMLTAALPFDPTVARRVISALSRGRTGAARRQIALMAAEAEKKGLLMPDEVWGLLAGLYAPHNEDQGESEPDDTAHEAEPSLVDQVRKAFRLQQDADHALHLLNHVVAGDAHWITIPFDARHAGARLTAVLRIRMPRAEALGPPTGGHGTYRWDVATIDVTTPTSTARFLLSPDPDGTVKWARYGNGDFPSDDSIDILSGKGESWA